MTDVRNEFGRWLRRRRKEAGFKQEELASRAGTSLRQIQRFEKGGVMPKEAIIKNIYKALGCSAHDFDHSSKVVKEVDGVSATASLFAITAVRKAGEPDERAISVIKAHDHQDAEAAVGPESCEEVLLEIDAEDRCIQVRPASYAEQKVWRDGALAAKTDRWSDYELIKIFEVPMMDNFLE